VRIVFLLTRSDVIGGVQVHVRDLCAALLADGHDPMVLVGGSGLFTEELASKGIPYTSLRYLDRPLRFPVRPVRDTLALREVHHMLRRVAPDIVSTHSSKAGWLGRLAAHRLQLPVLFTAHGWAFTEGVSRGSAFAYRWAERFAGPLADCIITVSECDRRLALKHRIATRGRLVTIHNGVDDVPESLRASPKATPTRLTMVARFERQKDHKTLLQALAQLRDQPWSIDLVGDGPLWVPTEALARTLGLSERVSFLGARNDVADHLARSQVFVLATRWEGLPRSVLEAMRAGLPVVATDVGGVREAVSDGETGFLTPCGDRDALAEKLGKLVAEPQLRAEMGIRGRRLYEQHFTFQRMYRETLALYRTVLEERSDRGK